MTVPRHDLSSPTGRNACTVPTTAAEHADAAAEAIRALNHATFRPGPSVGGYAEPGDVDAVLSSLVTLAASLNQTLTQAEDWLEVALSAGRIRHDLGADVSGAVSYVAECLSDARMDAAALARDLSDARSRSNHLGGFTGPDRGES